MSSINSFHRYLRLNVSITYEALINPSFSLLFVNSASSLGVRSLRLGSVKNRKTTPNNCHFKSSINSTLKKHK